MGYITHTRRRGGELAIVGGGVGDWPGLKRLKRKEKQKGKVQIKLLRKTELRRTKKW